MSNKCSHALYFPKNMSLELGKIKKNKKRHFTTFHRRLFLIFVFKKKVMRQGKKAKNRIQFFYQFYINFLDGFFCSSIILSDIVKTTLSQAKSYILRPTPTLFCIGCLGVQNTWRKKKHPASYRRFFTRPPPLFYTLLYILVRPKSL